MRVLRHAAAGIVAAASVALAVSALYRGARRIRLRRQRFVFARR